MIKLRVLKTNSNECDLLFRLVERGRRANLSYHYFSVDTCNLEEGWVKFTLLQCFPSPSLKVGVAGSSLIISMRDEREVKNWLKEWKIKFHKKCRLLVANTPKQASQILRERRASVMSAKKRKIVLTKLYEKIRLKNEKENSVLLKAM